MDNKTFEEITRRKESSKGQPFWEELNKKYQYHSPEALRSAYRQESRRRGKVIEEEPEQSDTFPRVIVADIENTPLQVYTFDLWNQNISPDQIICDTFLLSWSAKLLNDPKVYGQVLTPDEALRNDDSRIVRGVWEFLNNSQILIGHNLRDFDMKKLATRFLYHNLPPLTSYQVVDTLLVAKNTFAFTSNRLGYINKFLGIKQKQETEGFALWRKCVEGNPDALQTMFEYNKFDVIATEDLYYRLRPYIKGHPNLGLFFDTEESMCPNCGSLDLKNEGYYFSGVNKYTSLRCNSCGALSRKRDSVLDKDKKKYLLRN